MLEVVKSDVAKLNVVVAGAAGKMGQRIGALAVEGPDTALAGAFERQGHPSIGKDFGEVAGISKTGVVISDGIGEILSKNGGINVGTGAGIDVVIDFTVPESTLLNAKTCAGHGGMAMVIGTTGLTDDQVRELKSYATSIAVVFAPNMSVGVNLLLKVLQNVAATLGDDYDVEIIEAHHRLKKDAPSGTALKMASVLASALDRDLKETAVYCREGIIGQRSKKEIGIQTIRAGDIVGEHTVIFGGLGERIEITHKASSRDTFARGALRAALWLKGKPAGLYDMQDVLGLK
ncbi:MAG: 4-hydroxy-tetrahydrodipicolinate reductase [Nitrospirae bacterium]|nr:4-hydroxy-tetrahydrodipicolinate reductase [Nitrospirota bacterium]